MRKLNGSKWSFATVIGAVLVLALFGTTGAVAGSLVTSAKIKNNTIKSKDVRNNALTSADVKTSSLNGTDIADGSLTNADVGVHFASINDDGTVAGSSSPVTVGQPALGRYSVRFTGLNIKACAFTATPANTGGPFAPTGIIGVGDELNHPEGVYLYTKTDTGSDADFGFHLVVVC